MGHITGSKHDVSVWSRGPIHVVRSDTGASAPSWIVKVIGVDHVHCEITSRTTKKSAIKYATEMVAGIIEAN